MSVKCKRLELCQLSRLRIEEGKQLLDAGFYAGSYYLSGYAVECALKAVIAGHRSRHEFPDKHFAAACNTHNLYALMKLAQLELELVNAIRTSAAFSENWTAVLEWTEAARYAPVVPAQQARCMYVACANQSKGVLPWIQMFW